MRKLFGHLVSFVLILFLANGCGVYSFTGASIAPDVKTITITNFADRSTLSPPTLSQRFSEKLREYFQRNTNLSLVKEQGDLRLEGQIVDYSVKPVAPQGNDIAANTRLTITVKAKFTDIKHKENDYEQTFTFFKDFPQTQTLSSVEGQYIEDITDQIVLDIFTRSVANW